MTEHLPVTAGGGGREGRRGCRLMSVLYTEHVLAEGRLEAHTTTTQVELRLGGSQSTAGSSDSRKWGRQGGQQHPDGRAAGNGRWRGTPAAPPAAARPGGGPSGTEVPQQYRSSTAAAGQPHLCPSAPACPLHPPAAQTGPRSRWPPPGSLQGGPGAGTGRTGGCRAWGRCGEATAGQSHRAAGQDHRGWQRHAMMRAGVSGAQVGPLQIQFARARCRLSPFY